MGNSPLVSVIIPVFNGEKFLRRCLDSVLGQSMRDFELIVVDDGSDDFTPELLKEYESRHPMIQVVTQPNLGQGKARNRALGLARGEYVLFVDADDFIERVSLEVLTERADRDDSDLVHFDWKFSIATPDRSRQFDYYNIEPFWHLRILEGPKCEQLFRMNSYFSVTNLYRRSFLNAHNIRYEEGQIYEDNPFLAQVFTRANLVSLVHSPLYVIQSNPESSTKMGTTTDRHLRDHLSAVRKSFALATPRTASAFGDLAEYHLEKFAVYFERRVPKRLRAEYARGFVAILAEQPLNSVSFGRKTSWLTKLCIRLRVFDRQRPRVLQTIVEGKIFLTPVVKNMLSLARKLKRRVRHPLVTLNNLRYGREPALTRGTILFLGFDSRYTGNSRALFEQLLGDERFSGRQILFATEDIRVERKYRIKPESLGFLRAAQRAEFVVAETWIPSSVPKHPDSTWIQLWHGTPIKRMLFDSHEREITLARPAHKVNKYKDIQRWDYFVVDGEEAEQHFSTAFLLPPEKMLRAEYPRVTRLRGRATDMQLRKHLREEIGGGRISESTHVILYAPTWRDYNYGRPVEQGDFNYLLDLTALAEKLDEGFFFLFKDHDYSPGREAKLWRNVLAPPAAEIEDLLLISDRIVTDFSSVAFDAASVGNSVTYYRNDTERFDASRGTYAGKVESYSTIPTIVTELLAPERIDHFYRTTGALSQGESREAILLKLLRKDVAER